MATHEPTKSQSEISNRGKDARYPSAPTNGRRSLVLFPTGASYLPAAREKLGIAIHHMNQGRRPGKQRAES